MTRLTGFFAAAALIGTALPAAAQMPLTPSRPLPPSGDAAAYVPPPPNTELALQAKAARNAPKSATESSIAGANGPSEVAGITGSNIDKSVDKNPDQTAKLQRKRPAAPSDSIAAELNRRELRMLQAGE